MTANGSEATGLEAEIERLVGTAEAEITQLNTQLIEINDRLRYLRHIVRAFTPPESTPKVKRTPRAGDGHASPKSMALVSRAILSMDGKRFSGPEILKLGVASQPTIYTCLRVFREREIIGRAGSEKVITITGKGAGTRETYRILDHEQLKELASAATQ